MLNQKTDNRSPLSSECSLFELETFFNRSALDKDSFLASGDPSCCFTNDDSMVHDQDEVSVIETKSHPWNTFVPSHASDSSAATLSGGYRLSSAASCSLGNVPLCCLHAAFMCSCYCDLSTTVSLKWSDISCQVRVVCVLISELINFHSSHYWSQNRFILSDKDLGNINISLWTGLRGEAVIANCVRMDGGETRIRQEVQVN